MQCCEFTVWHLVLDLPGLHVPGVVVVVCLKSPEGSEAPEGKSGRQ